MTCRPDRRSNHSATGQGHKIVRIFCRRFLALLCATAQQSCYCRHAGIRRLSDPFSQNPSSRLIPKLVERFLRFFTIFFFVFVNTGPHGRKTDKQIHSKKFMHTSRDGFYQFEICIKIGEISIFGFLPIFFFFFRFR